jgi:methionyl-tRNA synthetase
LSNGLGNLVSRLTALCESAGVTAGPHETSGAALPGYREHLAEYRFDLALETVWEEITRINGELAAAKPWDDIRAGQLVEAARTIGPWLARLRTIATALAPFLPGTSAAITKILAKSPIRKCDPLFPRLSPAG